MKFIRDIIAEKRNASPAASIPSEIEEVIYPPEASEEESDELTPPDPDFAEDDIPADTLTPADTLATEAMDVALDTEETAQLDDDEEDDAPLDEQISGLLETLNRQVSQPKHEDDHAPDATDTLHWEQDEPKSVASLDTKADMNASCDEVAEISETAETLLETQANTVSEPEGNNEEANESASYDSEPVQSVANGTSPIGMLKRSPRPVQETSEPASVLPRARPTQLTRSTTRLHTPAPETSGDSEHVVPGPTQMPTEPVTPIAVPRPASARSGGRSGRVKTRILGFSGSDNQDPDPFSKEAGTRPEKDASFPVGWLVVIDGPGRGTATSLYDGVSQIGRGKTQAVQLNFGDNSISRENHAAIAFDSEQGEFFIGHGGKANLVRLNNQPVLSTQKIASHDTIRIGETTLLFIGLCGPDFSWQEK